MSFFLPSYFILFLFDLITIISVVFGLLFHFFVCIITSWEIDGETVETVSDFILGGPKSLQMVTAVIKLKDTYSLEGKL